MAKLADFGTVRLAPKLKQVSHVTTRNIVGTSVYMPPEYCMSGRVSAKTDTYAFGVCLFELLTGKPPADPVTRVMLVDELGKEFDAPERLLRPQHLDPRIEWDMEVARRLAAVGGRCVAKERDRCTVTEVLAELDALAGRTASASSS